MSYTERNWKPTAVLVCKLREDTNVPTLDKTAKEIIEALENDYVVMLRGETEKVGIQLAYCVGVSFEDKMILFNDTVFTYDNLDDYPTQGNAPGPDSGGSEYMNSN